MLAVNPKYAREGMNPDEVRTVAQQLDNVFVHVVAPTPEKRRTAPPGFEAMC